MGADLGCSLDRPIGNPGTMLNVRGVAAPIRPELLLWARETSGLSQDEAAARLQISQKRLAEAEEGRKDLTLIQARKAAEIYGRPLATLFLNSPPVEDTVEVQFRRLRDAPSLPWPAEMRALARQVLSLQDDAAALLDGLEYPTRWATVKQQFTRNAVADDVSDAVRSIVGVSEEDQFGAARQDAAGYLVLRQWRLAVEALGLLVLQDGSVPLEKMRGFLSPHPTVPAIVINIQEDPRARLYTLVHEFGHLVLPEDAEEEALERFAADVLMPQASFSRAFKSASRETLLGRVDEVARTFGVTPRAAATRVGWLGLARWPEVHATVKIIKERGTGASKPGGGTHYRNVVARLGPGFVGRILEGVDAGVTSPLAAARLLSVRVERLDRLRAEIEPRRRGRANT